MRYATWIRFYGLVFMLTFTAGCPSDEVVDDDIAGDDDIADDDDSVGDDDDSAGDDDDSADDDDDQVPTGSSFVGETSLMAIAEGETVCSATLDLTGTAYTGACEDCEFVFQIESTVLEQDGDQDCILDWGRIMFHSGWYDCEHLLAFADEFEHYGNTYHSVLMAGFAYSMEYFDTPDWLPLGCDGCPYNGTFDTVGQDISWGAYQSYEPYGAEGYWRIEGSGTLYP